ncbi:membrane protein insertion efficiency factor YidD [Asprobacillus argus]|uniref:membrane protein insertion efficiency factor YidD n=1 Tax=Asprobacillus argus TaxID=3076534 RepID=UPI003D76A00F
MKVFLLISIRVYWLLIPKVKRRRCLFKKSCSQYVYDITKREGLLLGMKALRFRIKNCNSKYNIIDVGKEKILITKTHKIFKEKDISPFLLE